MTVAAEYPAREPAREPARKPARIRVTAYRAPNGEPPYDAEPPSRLRSAPALAPWTEPAGGRPLRLVPEPEPEPDEDDDFDFERTPRELLEDPRPRAAVLARALMEALAGDRPLGQLLRWMTPEVFAKLEPLVAARGTRPGATAVRRVFVAEPTPGIAEVTAVVQRGPRCGALALRLEGLDGRWIVTALQIG